MDGRSRTVSACGHPCPRDRGMGVRFIGGWLRLFDVSVEAVGEEDSFVGGAASSDDLNNLGRRSGEGDGVGIGIDESDCGKIYRPVEGDINCGETDVVDRCAGRVGQLAACR